MTDCRFLEISCNSNATNASISKSINSNPESKEKILNNTTAEITPEYDELAEVTETTALLKESKYTRNQWKILIVFPVLNFLAGACFSLQAPFFPKEAEIKGVSPSIYGFTIGIYHLAILILSPPCGKCINKTGARFMISSGNYITAVAVILFGLLEYISGTLPFIISAFILRIAQGAGNAAFTTACYAIAAVEFPENISVITSILQIGFALGRIAGPAIGGLLYQDGGYMLPFVFVGGILFGVSILTTIILPPMETKLQTNFRLTSLLTMPSILIATFQTISLMISYGFLTSTLEPHLRQFHLQPSLLGLMFIIDGITGSIANAFWGYIAKKQVSLKLLSGISSMIVAVAFFIVGPSPFVPIRTSLWMIVLALLLIGLNLGGQIIIPYVDNTQEVIRNGYPKTVETFALISGLWNSSVNLGSFIGSSISGIILDEFGFRWSSMLFVVLQLMASTLSIGYYWVKKSKDAFHSGYVKEI